MKDFKSLKYVAFPSLNDYQFFVSISDITLIQAEI